MSLQDGWRSMDRRAIGYGALVGLVTGTIGLAIGGLSTGSMSWALLGAVCGGGTAAWLVEGSLGRHAAYALGADLLSSAIFFLVVTVGYPVLVGLAELNPVAGGAAALFLVVAGLAFAIPVAVLSAGVALVAGILVGLFKRIIGASGGPPGRTRL